MAHQESAEHRRRIGWLKLALAPRLGAARIAAMADALALDQELAALSHDGALMGVQGLAAETSAWLGAPATDEVLAALDWALRPGHAMVCLDEPHYPPQLRAAPAPPPVLFARGDTALLCQPQLAVVGSRVASQSGLRAARDLARAAAAAGLVVTSGLARGVDGAAHRGALDARSAATVAVLAHGLDMVYPASHASLAEAIVDAGGVLVSEMPPAEPVTRAGFPRRNRIIAGLSLGVLVVEANVRSGSLITARLAGEYGREVLAVPGVALSSHKRGCHMLLRDGAALVEHIDDVLAALPSFEFIKATAPHPAPVETEAAADPVEKALLGALAGAQLRVGELLAMTGLSSAAAVAGLTRLELRGRVARLPDNRFELLGNR